MEHQHPDQEHDQLDLAPPQEHELRDDNDDVEYHHPSDDEAETRTITNPELHVQPPAQNELNEHDSIGDILQQERDQVAASADNDNDSPTTPTASAPTTKNRYGHLLRASGQADADRAVSSDTSVDDALPDRPASPNESLLSVPDDTPSIQGSLLSSPGSSVLPSLASRPGLASPAPSFRPFDRRFQSRIASPASYSPSLRPSSPAFLASHSRNVSLSSQLLSSVSDIGDTDSPSPPWEVVRWTKLKKLNGQAFSEAGRRNFGAPTCLAVSASIVLGTSKGIICVFDYNQNLKMIIGPGTKAVESGPVTAIAISADHTTIAGGHASGSIFTWDTSRPSRPFLHIPHLDQSQLEDRTMDGHMPQAPVRHLGFLGTRHTALVSADERGMAFSHLATRGTGALGRTVKTARILGRYPNAPTPAGKSLKPSTILAFSPLPLGNVECPTDSMGLTAMLTPYLLVIVSTTPIAQTQHKSARPKDVAPHSAMSGCLAWFPAVRLKVPDPATGSTMSKVKLVYCWSNVLTVLDVDEIPSEDKDKPPGFRFKARSRWKCEEAIVAVQWLSRSVLTVLTITQRLIVLEDYSMRMTEAFDLAHKYIYHADLFSAQLHKVVEQLDEEDTSMHGVVADAFYMSMKAYKGRIFLLGFNDVSIGALSNWADRLIAMMENGDYIGAIQLATSYFTGDADKLTVGLPEDTTLRHQMVRDKILEIMTASLKYAFSQRQKDTSKVNESHLRELVETCFVSCQKIDDDEFIFDEMYEWYEEGGVEGIFLEVLEPYVLEGAITIVPPTAVKAMVTHFVRKGWESRLEEMICHMNTATLDLDQITQLCKQHGLYDALIYVWNQALRDYITPLIDLLTLLMPRTQSSGHSMEDVFNDNVNSVNALKMFPYLSYTLTGRVYPTGDFLDDASASQAKAEVYWFLFSGQSVTWPKGSKKVFLTQPSETQEPSFPYLRMILKFDAPSLLSALNEAFEDSFLNESPEKQLIGGTGRDLPEEQIFGLTVDRQYIVSILLEIMNPSDFAAEDTIYLDMFIARNLPKFPQYLLVPGTTLNRIITGLCNYPGSDLAEDAQLSAEYLLSVYQPPDLTQFMPLFKKAGFYRILKRTYKNESQFGKLILTYFEDPDDQEGVFECIADCLKPAAGLSKKQIHDVHDVIQTHSRDLVGIDPVATAQTLGRYAPELHRHALGSLEDEPGLQYPYLKAILEPEENIRQKPVITTERDFVEQYVQLMCRFDPAHVSDYVERVQATDLRLDKVLSSMEETGVIDAAVILMAREGHVQDAMARLTKHLDTLASSLQGLLSNTKGHGEGLNVQDTADELLQSLQKYTHVGIWLCQGQMKSTKKLELVARKQSSLPTNELSPAESLWLDLIDTTVQITRRLSSLVGPDSAHGQNGEAATPHALDSERSLALLRSLVQHTFTALLNVTSTRQAGSQAIDYTDDNNSASNGTKRPVASSDGNATFLRILRAFLARAAETSPSLADLRSVLASVFAAYAYEETILGLSARLLDRQLFTNVRQAVTLRQRGWRPKGSTCEACGRRIWGPGVQGNMYEAWEQRQTEVERQRRERKAQPLTTGSQGHQFTAGLDSSEDANGKGKGRAIETEPHGSAGATSAGDSSGEAHQPIDNPAGARQQQQKQQQPSLEPLVVLACRHIFHKSCLETLQAPGDPGHTETHRQVDDYGREIEGCRKIEYICPIDG